MQLPMKRKLYYDFFAFFPKSSSNSENFERKMTLIVYVFLELWIEKDVDR